MRKQMVGSICERYGMPGQALLLQPLGARLSPAQTQKNLDRAKG
jgi:hypothetical protein